MLIQSRTRLKEYERALRENGIPFQVSGGTVFFQQDEVLTILSVLKFLENRLDVFSLRQALKSPLFGIPEWIIPPLTGKDFLSESPEFNRRPRSFSRCGPRRRRT